MALEAAFGELRIQLQRLRELFTDLRTTIVEDKPPQDDVVLVELWGDGVDDLLGWLEGALEAADKAQQAVAYPGDLNQAWRALVICHAQFQHIYQRFAAELICYERINELTRFGRRRGGEWQAWANSVKAALVTCQTPLFDLSQALFGCWQEIAEHSGMQTVSMQVTHIGPKISVSEKCATT
ncbi:MAG: hypothetical protein U0350_23375 [Caldilineaceae bacterium]